MIAINGFINLYKPADWTSHDCVARLRRLLNTKKIGHGGTLDPKATGVLPIAVGKATRLLQYLPDGKAYQAVVRFGMTTTTDDLEGDIVTQQSAAAISLKDVEAALLQFSGEIDQTPPIYSAIQVEGKRLYHLARRGKTVEVPTRRVTIHQLKSQHWQPGERAELTLDVVCGPGTYIRSLARDLGAAMGIGATLANLVRTHSGGFDLIDSITLEGIEQAMQVGQLEPVEAGRAMQHLPAIALSPDLARRWCMGQKLPISDQMTGKGRDELAAVHQDSPSAPLRVLDAKTQVFLGIGEIEMGEPTVALSNDPDRKPTPIKILSCKRVYLSQDVSGLTAASVT